MEDEVEYYIQQCNHLEGELHDARAEINDLHRVIDSLQQDLQYAEGNH